MTQFLKVTVVFDPNPEQNPDPDSGLPEKPDVQKKKFGSNTGFSQIFFPAVSDRQTFVI